MPVRAWEACKAVGACESHYELISYAGEGERRIVFGLCFRFIVSIEHNLITPRYGIWRTDIVDRPVIIRAYPLEMESSLNGIVVYRGKLGCLPRYVCLGRPSYSVSGLYHMFRLVAGDIRHVQLSVDRKSTR